MPTFRGKDGLWNNYSAEELATPSAFARNPELVWEWYRWRLGIVLSALPNPAHEILARLESEGLDVSILTQNVDDLHERAGSTSVQHLHGKIREARCTGCKERFTWTKELLEEHRTAPACPACGSLFRPDVVWFGESLDRQVLDTCTKRLAMTDVLLVAGTSGVVYPVAYFPLMAKQMNSSVKIYEFNLENTPVSSLATRTVLGPVEKTLVDFFTEEVSLS